MKNSKGFTLVELLAAVVILGILTAFAVPSIMKVITNNRDKTYREDAKKMVTLAESRIRSGKIVNPLKGRCLLVTINGLESGEFKKAPNGGEYDKDESFVLVKRNEENNDKGMPQYSYYVYLVEKYGDNYRGIDFQEIKNDADISKSSDGGIEIQNFTRSNKFAGVMIGETSISEQRISSRLDGYIKQYYSNYNIGDIDDRCLYNDKAIIR